MLAPLFCFVFPFLSPLHLVFFVFLSQISQCLKDLKLTSPISFQDKDYLNNFCFLFNCANNGNIISSLSPFPFTLGTKSKFPPPGGACALFLATPGTCGPPVCTKMAFRVGSTKAPDVQPQAVCKLMPVGREQTIDVIVWSVVN